MPKLLRNRTTALLALEWCKKKWKKSRYHSDYPKIRILNRSARDLYGWYDEEKNLITINMHLNRRVIDIIDTVIHEYTHYTQDCKNLYDKLWEENAHRPYREHPLEREAYRRQEKYGKICKSEIESWYVISV
jgi:hypothetical protein